MAKKISIKIFPPHSEKQRKVMLHLANRTTMTKTIWVACGTKWGKSISASGSMAYAVPKFKDTLWRWVAPIQKQTKIGRRYVKRMLPPEPYVKENKADNIIYIPAKDTEIQFWHGQNPEDLEGEAVIGQINDECAKMKKQVIDSSRTTWTVTRAQVLNISTPRGKNFFYKGCMKAKEEMERAKFEKREPKEIFITAPTSDNPHVHRSVIEENKRLLPDRLFRQYYLAEFIDDGEVFPKVMIDTDTWISEFVKESATEVWIHPDHKEMTIVAGCDWAKTTDYTVLTCWDYTRLPFRCVGFLRMQGKKYPKQLLAIARFLFRFKSCDMLYHDKTGIGTVIDDMLDDIPGLVYEGIVFSNASKAQLVNDLINGMELHEILFPDWPALMTEFKAFEVRTNDIGQMFYAAGTDEDHDDIVISCCLGYAACKHYANSQMEVKFLEELNDLHKEVKTEFQKYYEDDADIDFDEGF